jgi:MoaA/NifB/PqqE/SkfB family radical SAM enzyme
MKQYFYRQVTGDIILSDTLEVIKLNSVAKIIFENFNQDKSVDDIATSLAEQFQVDLGQVKKDVVETLKTLSEIGIVSWEQTPFQLHTVIMHIIQNCNSPCKLCDCWKTKKNTQLSLADLQPVIEWLADYANNQNVMVSGGEPLLHNDLQNIIGAIRSKKMRVLLNTNGLLLQKHPWISSETVDEVIISMDGFDADSYKKVRGVDGYERVWQNIKMLKTISPYLPISLRVILNKGNIDQFFEIVRKARQQGIHRVGISPLDLTSSSFNRTKLNHGPDLKMQSTFLPSLEQIQSFRDCIKDSPEGEIIFQDDICDWGADDFVRCLDFYQSLHFGQNLGFNSESCLFPMSALVIDYDGGIKPCFYSDAIVDLREPQKYVERFDSEMTKMADTGKCKNCRGKVFCDVQF